MRVLGIIPARGGSKGVPSKNIIKINGKPLIQYTLDTVTGSRLLKDVFVSTDSDEILELVNKIGGKTLKRSSKNATDTSSVNDVIHEVLKKIDKSYDIIMLLQPTAPIREPSDIDNVIKMFQDKEVTSVVSVVELDDIHPARMYSLCNNRLLPLVPEDMEKRRQDLEPVYLRNGAIYAIRMEAFKEHDKIILPEGTPYIMPQDQWLNIDAPRDIKIAEVFLKKEA